ncbi:MAG: type II secretion system protein GspM [Gammaproteobacteria bacterium]
MKAWFRSLERREQLVVMAGAAVLVIVLFYLLVVQPLYGGTARLAERVEEKEQLVLWMRSVAPQLQVARTGAATATASGEPLVVIVANTATAAELQQYLKQNQPAGDDSIRVRFEAAPFDQLVQWLGVLQSRHGVQINSASFDGGVQPGVVTASLVLERPGA